MFQVKHASVRRNDAIILDDVTLSIKKGEHVAVIGPNGAGKSTLLKILTKEVHPLAKDGSFYAFMGDERIPLLALREKLGIVSPSLLAACNTTYTALEVVISGLFSSYGLDFHHVVTDEDRAKALEEMEKTGTTYLKDKYMNSLSSGEAEKVILARAAVHNPEALILDEVSSALDFPMRASLRNMIGRYAREGKTIVMVTHELSEIPAECERVIVLKHGRIVADGIKKDILTEELLSSVYGQKVYVEEKNNIFSAWC
jgi:ABC-type molybdenum transport system, ATPase component/photorepair protein PhrA